MAINSNATSVILASAGPPEIVSVSVTTGAPSTTLLPTGHDPIGIASDPTNPSIAYVLDQPTGSVPEILRYDMAGGPPTPITSKGLGAVSQADTIAISPDGRTLYVGGSQDFPVAAISAISVTSAQVTSWNPPENVGGFTDLAVAPNGSALYASADDFGRSTVLSVGLNGGLTQSSPQLWQGEGLQITDARSVTVSPSGNAVFVGGTHDDQFGEASGVQSFRASDGTSLAFSRVPLDHTFNSGDAPVGGLESLAVTPDGRTVLAAGETLGATGALSPLVYPLLASGNLAVGPASALPGFSVSSPQGIAVTPDQAPIAVLSPASGTVGSPVILDAIASTVTYGSIVNYRWSFGDGQTATTTTPTISHVYGAAGNYTAQVTETDSAGGSVPPAPGTSGIFNVNGPGQTPFLRSSPAASAAASVAISPPGTPPPPVPTTTTTVPNSPTTPPPSTTPTTKPGHSTTTTVPKHGKPGVPTLKLVPVVGSPGNVVMVSGTGFAKNRPVTVRWSVSVGSVVIMSDSHGALPPRPLILLSPDLLGPRYAEAVGTPAKASFLVVPNTSEPGGDAGSFMFRTEEP
jgi:hypothetical protein